MILSWYTCFNTVSRLVVRKFNSDSLETAQLNAPVNSIMVEGDYSADKYYLNSLDQPEQLPEKPLYEFCQFDTATGSWLDEPEKAWIYARQQRNLALQESDWTDTTSAPIRLGAEVYNQWQVYRQALRDITLQTDPFTLVWPNKPGETIPVYAPIKQTQTVAPTIQNIPITSL
jgi:Phage tail assembly chaperone protein